MFYAREQVFACILQMRDYAAKKYAM